MMRKFFVRVGDEIDVLNGIAVDEQQIGKRAHFDDPQLSAIRIARTGQAEQLGIGGGCHLKISDVAYQRVRWVNIVPWRVVSVPENSRSEPNAVLIW